MNTHLPLRAATAFRSPRRVTAIRPGCSQSIKPPTSQWDGQCPTRQYSTPPPPPKTYFQPGDSQLPDPKYFQPVDATTLPPSPPKTYFQPSDSQSASGAHPPNTGRTPQRRRLVNTLYASFFLFVGITTGQGVSDVLRPPPPLEPGSPEDLRKTKVIHSLGEKLPIVKKLSKDPEWTSQMAFETLSEEEKEARLTTGPLGGSSALGGYRRVFFHKTSGEMVTVIYFGGAVCGFPRRAHGGLIATVLDEVLGTCAVRQFPAKTGVTANLEVKYLVPASTEKFYIIRAIPDAEGKTDRKCYVTGTLEDVKGAILVVGKGLFVVPKKLALKPITT
jgi:hypothetical protein